MKTIFKSLLFSIFALILFLMFAVTSNASFSIEIKNNKQEKLFYTLYWIDHNFDLSKPVEMAGGELEAQKSISLNYNYKGSSWVLIWRTLDGFYKVLRIDINPNKVYHVIATTDNINKIER